MTRTEYEALADQLRALAAQQRAAGEPIRDVADLIEATLPMDGPYDAPSTVAAGEVLDETARYLARATLSADAAPNVADLYAVTGSLRGMAARLQQVLRQMSHRLEYHTPIGTGLYDDRNEHPGGHSARAEAVRTRDVAVQQLEHALRALEPFAQALDAGQAMMGHLGNEHQDVDGGEVTR